jgi:GH24 family phage-related lysozyme (muramidase)
MNDTRQDAIKLALELIKHFEGCRLQAYVLQGENWATIGWGHALPLQERHTIWTQEQANRQLLLDLNNRNDDLKLELGAEYDKLTAGQLAGSLSFKYNVKPDLWRRSTFLALLKKGKPLEARYELKRWVHGEDGKELAGLIARRSAELFVFDGGSISDLSKVHKWFQH